MGSIQLSSRVVERARGEAIAMSIYALVRVDPGQSEQTYPRRKDTYEDEETVGC
jgi:hypothetical protein